MGDVRRQEVSGVRRARNKTSLAATEGKYNPGRLGSEHATHPRHFLSIMMCGKELPLKLCYR